MFLNTGLAVNIKLALQINPPLLFCIFLLFFIMLQKQFVLLYHFNHKDKRNKITVVL